MGLTHEQARNIMADVQMELTSVRSLHMYVPLHFVYAQRPRETS